ncbi:hypothetical protein LTR56_006176 [Elasticomyces elasticus]|nr:hypothetical protein LTR56_006176 [Elasticomyces elasticus]KAK3666614.1 hypothetical protein LTR22_002558 [Elasticomyces elasticus]KAK4928252.1 hypothetical protein LTR49_004929 [Elasticomyces elasticus]KAK5763815.1 hypothetical protein LTS12_005933 [Elasticomyces elasticus]
MSSQDLILQILIQDNSILEKVLETLHVLQQAEPRRFRSSKFKIQKKGHREDSRVQNFSTYSGPDLMTHKVLEGSAGKWMQNPITFWSNPGQESGDPSSRCPPAQLVALYINAKCDDA